MGKRERELYDLFLRPLIWVYGVPNHMGMTYPQVANRTVSKGCFHHGVCHKTSNPVIKHGLSGLAFTLKL